MVRLDRAFILLCLLTGCPDDGESPPTDADDDATSEEGGSTMSSDESSASESGVSTGEEPTCESVGKPEMTGPITGLQPSYLAGDPMQVGVPVDEDTSRVIVGIYEVGSELYLGGTAEDFTGPTVATLDFFAGVADGETGEFYLSVELCSTETCTTPFVRNTYQRVDRTIPLAAGELYQQTRENVGTPAMPETCATDIAIQSFTID